MNSTNALSRRAFGGLVGSGVAAAVLPPLFAQTRQAARSSGASVRLSANENPYGPSASALAAMHDSMRLAWRYPDEAADVLTETIAKLHGVSTDQVILGAGSSEILKLTSAAFSGPSRKVVMADPTFEALAHYGAHAAGAEVVKVPLTSSYAHDLAKMSSVPGAGVIYLCNPNNPTGSITGKQAVRAFIDTLPAQTIALVDEAYFHYADSNDYDTVIPLVQSKPNLIVARTFSKIYGMAGVRCGYGVAQAATIERLRQQQAWDSANIIALTGAQASLLDPRQVIEARRRNSETKGSAISTITRLGYDVVPSQTNFIMIDIRRPVKPAISAIRERGVHVGRLFQAMPQHLRVTIGTPEQMQRFLDAFRSVMV